VIFLIHIIGNINYYLTSWYFGRQSCIHAKLLVFPIRTRYVLWWFCFQRWYFCWEILVHVHK